MQQVKNVSWWHERLADWLIANPHLHLKDAAREFQVTQSYLSVLRNSDSFRAYWERRSSEASEAIIGGIREKTAAVAELALDHMLETLERPHTVLPPAFVLQTMDTALRRLGYGAQPRATAPTNSVTVNVAMVSAGELAAARKRIEELHNVQVATPLEVQRERDLAGDMPDSSDYQLLRSPAEQLEEKE